MNKDKKNETKTVVVRALKLILVENEPEVWFAVKCIERYVHKT